MQDTSKISKRQLFFMIFLSRIILILGDTNFFDIKINAAEYAVSAAAGIAILCVIYFASGAAKIDCKVLSKGFLTALSFILFVFTIIETAFTLKKLFENMYAELTPVIIALLITVIVVCLSLKHGIEGIARLSFVVALIIIASLAFTLVPNAVNFEAQRVTSVYDISGAGLCAAVIKQFVFFPELALFFTVSSVVNEKIQVKSALKLYIMLASVTALFYVFYEGVLGDAVYLNRFSISALSQAGEFSIFRRIEAMRSSLWIVAVVTRLSMYGAGISFILNKGKGIICRSRTACSCIIVSVSILVACFVGFGYINNFLYVAISSLVMLCLFILPFCLIKRRSDV